MNEELIAQQNRAMETSQRLSSLDYAAAILRVKDNEVSVERVLQVANAINDWVAGTPRGTTQQ